MGSKSHPGNNTNPITTSSSPLTLGAVRWWLLLILLLITVPYLLAWLSTPDGMVFTGALINPDDMGTYVSAMRQGASGNWLYHFKYSPEPWQPRLMLLLYLLLGKVTSLFAEPTVFWLHFWRVLLSFVTLWAIVTWVRTLLPSEARWQRTAWLLLLFGNGVGWAAVYFVSSPTRLLPDIGLPEWSALTALLNTPHFALGVGLITLTFVCLVRLESAETPRQVWCWTAMAAVTALLASLVYVYHLAIVGLVIGVYVLLHMIQRRPWQQWLPFLVVGLPLLPLLLYYAFGDMGDVYWQAYTQQDHVIPPPPLAGVLIGYGALGLLAIAGGRWWLQRGMTPLLPLWAVVNLLALYMPGIAYSGRFALGLSIPVATLATVGLEAVFLPAVVRSQFARRLQGQPSFASLRRMSLYLLVPSTVVMLLLLIKGPQVEPGFPYYLPAADVDAAVWLGNVAAESSVTLAYYPMGNYLPHVYQGKVFLGQADFTTDLEQKLLLFEQFWGGTMSAAEQGAFLQEWQIDYIFAGTYEAPYQKASAPAAVEVAYQAEGVTIYRVR